LIPYARHSLSEDDITAVVNALRSGNLTQGPMVPAFERAVCNYVGSKYGVATNSATSALHIACESLGAKSGDVIWTSPISFVASANCALYCGASIDFVDIDPKTFNICPDLLHKRLVRAKNSSQRPKILIVVHMAGQSANMDRIHELAVRFDFRIIEDASHSLGAEYNSRRVGCCEYSDVAVFSFHPSKIIAAAEGGIAVTNDKELAANMELIKSHGVTRDRDLFDGPSDGDWYYQQLCLGYNYRLSDIHAALGLSQLERIEQFLEARRAIARHYDEQLDPEFILPPFRGENRRSSFHLYIIKTKSPSTALRDRLFDALVGQGIRPNVHYIPIHTQPFFRKLGFKSGDFPNAEDYYRRALSLPIFPDFPLSEASRVADIINEAAELP